MKELFNDGKVKSPSAVLCFISRHCDVLLVRLFPQDSHALHMDFLLCRRFDDFLKVYQ